VLCWLRTTAAAQQSSTKNSTPRLCFVRACVTEMPPPMCCHLCPERGGNVDMCTNTATTQGEHSDRWPAHPIAHPACCASLTLQILHWLTSHRRPTSSINLRPSQNNVLFSVLVYFVYFDLCRCCCWVYHHVYKESTSQYVSLAFSWVSSGFVAAVASSGVGFSIVYVHSLTARPAGGRIM
jgi:hypothetical protein